MAYSNGRGRSSRGRSARRTGHSGAGGQSNAARYRRMRRRRRRQIQVLLRLGVLAMGAALVIFAVSRLMHLLSDEDSPVLPVLGQDKTDEAEQAVSKLIVPPPDYDVQLLTVNPYSRPGDALEEVNGVVVHWTANPGTTAQQNRGYFESLKDTHETSASSHFIIGIEGELIQCIPCNEIAYASNSRNGDTISVECCIRDDTGRFTQETYDTLVHLVAWLRCRYDLGKEDVIRHYDVTGKDCPKYFVDHEDAWEQFREDVDEYIRQNGVLDNGTSA